MAAAGCGGPVALLALLLAAAAAARLYRAGEDPLTVLAAGSVRRALLNSSAAWVVQFYSSSCGHCIAFAPTWRALAGDVKGEAPAPSPPRRALTGPPHPGKRSPPPPGSPQLLPSVRPGCRGPDPAARSPLRPLSGPRAAAVSPRCWGWGRSVRVGRSGASSCLGARGHPWGLGSLCHPWALAVPPHK